MCDDDRASLATELKRRFARKANAVPRAAGVREYPMSFAPALLAAILDGRKTETRRPVRPQSAVEPPVSTGDLLWVRETWAHGDAGFVYQRDGNVRPARWFAASYMPRDAARLFLPVTGVRRERLSAIDEAAAIVEGFAASPLGNVTARDAFLATWDTFYGSGEFAVTHDPWVWVIGFERRGETS